jgi:UPF0176 protein
VFEVIIFYKYTSVADPVGFMKWIRRLCETIGIKGRILIAREGMNGTVEGTRKQLDQFETALHETSFGDFQDVWFKASPGTGNAFKKLRVKARENILNAGLEEDIDPNQVTGKHIEADELHEWLARGEDFAIVDMRNDYEYAVGRFSGSIDSGMGNFRDLPTVTPKLEHLKNKKVLTVCTYGVRCEKASGYLLEQGFKNVYQLHGGIGTYIKKYPGQHFEGSLYVFDERMTEQFTDTYRIVGVCVGCNNASERFGNCAWHECHKQLIICETCSTQPVWCSEQCKQ